MSPRLAGSAHLRARRSKWGGTLTPVVVSTPWRSRSHYYHQVAHRELYTRTCELWALQGACPVTESSPGSREGRCQKRGSASLGKRSFKQFNVGCTVSLPATLCSLMQVHNLSPPQPSPTSFTMSNLSACWEHYECGHRLYPQKWGINGKVKNYTKKPLECR